MRPERKKKRVCYLCGKEEREGDSLNRDHVPAKCLFRTKGNEFKDGLITLQAHTSCNTGKKADDEYLRLLVVTKAYQGNADAKYLWDEKLMTQIRRPEGHGFHSMIKENLKVYEVHTLSGIYLGKRPALNLDGDRLSKILFRICQGLFFKEAGHILPETTPYLVYPMIDEFQVLKKRGIDEGRFKSVGKGAFKYAWVHEDIVKVNGYFLMTFYDVFDMVVCLGTKARPPATTPLNMKLRAI
jgi:hypothetical protein